ncbi:hypothetical protein T06_13783 [Trichinella sp. T6]|nr:hypothetical protein T06_13783 [Trichinella sp. T6]
MTRIKLCHHSVVRFICRTQRISSVDAPETKMVTKNLTIRSSVARIIRRGCYVLVPRSWNTATDFADGTVSEKQNLID